MNIISTINEVREQIKEWKKQGLTVGLVPTMGYLHEGHKSLIDALVFHPEPSEMYHQNYSTYVDMRTLTQGLCGKTRPTHFSGVCTVVSKLFHIVQPDRAYFGQKDAQQLAVIKHMVEDLNFDIKIVGCPIIREEDGLAKSSRNTYLNEEERKQAVILNQALQKGKEQIENGERRSSQIKQMIIQIIETMPLAKIDYVEIVDFQTLESIEEIKGEILVAVAVYIGKTRLIDNFIMKIESEQNIS